MATTINITAYSAPLPEGWEGTPDEFRQQVFSTIHYEAEGDFLFGQIGGSTPTSNVGIWVNGQDIYTWDEESQTYKPISTIPIGVALPYFGTIAPDNYLMCDGAEYEIEDYKDLYAVIGDAHKKSGEEDNDKFRVPWTPGRSLVGKGTGDYTPVAASSGGLMKEIEMNEYGGWEWPRRKQAKHAGQPAGNTDPGDGMIYPAGSVGPNFYTRARGPYLGCNYIIRAK